MYGLHVAYSTSSPSFSVPVSQAQYTRVDRSGSYRFMVALEIVQEDAPIEATEPLLDDHLTAVVDEGGTTWSKGHSPRFENFSWEDAR